MHNYYMYKECSILKLGIYHILYTNYISTIQPSTRGRSLTTFHHMTCMTQHQQLFVKVIDYTLCSMISLNVY